MSFDSSLCRCLRANLLPALAALACWAGVSVASADLGLLEQEAVRRAVDRVAPSVVRIETVGGLERLEGAVLGGGPTTGLVVTADGYIASSAFGFLHRPASILVQMPDGGRKPARLVAADHNRKFVLLKIEPDKPLTVPEIAPPAELKVGQWTIAVGRTFESGQPNLAVGVLSATSRVWGKAVQTDAAVSPNNYGGPLVDLRGRVIGLLVPLSPIETSELAGVEWYDSGIGFAVPAQTILELLPRLREGKDLWPGLTGLRVVLQTLYTADSVIPAVRPRSPAHQAGFRAGDRIVEIDGRKIESMVQVKQEISRRYAGDKIRLAVLRGSERIERELELAARLDPDQHPFLGILPMRGRAGDEEAKSAGVKVRYVYPGGPAAKADVLAGDVIVSAGVPVRDAAQLRARLADFQPGDKVAIELRRGQETRKADVTLAELPEAVPGGRLPPAREPAKAAESKRPPVGALQLSVPELPEETWGYVSETYEPGAPAGVVVWLSAPGERKPEEVLSLWKEHCDRDGLILLAPKPLAPTRWQTREARTVPLLLAQIAAQYTVDPDRVVVCGRQTGGTVAMLAAMRYPQVVRAAVAVDAPAEGRIPEIDPARRLSFYLATAASSRSAGRIRETVSRLRQMHHPVTVKDLGPEPRDLRADEVSELARWIDSLDRI